MSTGKRNVFDEGHTLALGDWVKFELIMREGIKYGVLLSIDEPQFSGRTPGPRIYYCTGDVHYYAVNGQEINTEDTIVCDFMIDPRSDVDEIGLGSGSYKRTAKVNELLIQLELALDRDSVRDVIDHLLRVPESSATLAGEVIRLPSSYSPNLLRIHEFSLSNES